jgi:uncharacterized phage-like protein YoqJ
MREKTCCFTGHRKIPPGQYNRIAEQLREEIITLIKNGIIFFGAGGALGFDTLAALTVLSLKKEYLQIKLILVLPCPTQTKGWAEKDVEIYEDIKARCDKYVYTSQEYTRGCMFKRNRHLADNSSICICYLTEKSGGTAYTVDYSMRKELKIINLAQS